MCTRAVQSNGDVHWLEPGHSEADKDHVWKEKEDKTKGKKYYTNLGTGAKEWSLPGEKKEKKDKEKKEKGDKPDKDKPKKSKDKSDKKDKGDNKADKSKEKNSDEDDDDDGGGRSATPAVPATPPAVRGNSGRSSPAVSFIDLTVPSASLSSTSSAPAKAAATASSSPFAAIPDDQIKLPQPHEYLPQPHALSTRDPKIEDLKRFGEKPTTLQDDANFVASLAAAKARSRSRHINNGNSRSPDFESMDVDDFLPGARPGSPREPLTSSEERDGSGMPGVRGMSPVGVARSITEAEPRSSPAPAAAAHSPMPIHNFANPGAGVAGGRREGNDEDEDDGMDYPSSGVRPGLGARRGGGGATSSSSSATIPAANAEPASAAAATKKRQSMMDVDAFLFTSGVPSMGPASALPQQQQQQQQYHGRSASQNHGVMTNFDADFESFLRAERSSREASLARSSPVKLRHPADERRMELIDAMFKPPKPIPADEMARLSVGGLVKRQQEATLSASAVSSSPFSAAAEATASGTSQQHLVHPSEREATAAANHYNSSAADFLTESLYQDLESSMSDNELRYLQHLRRCVGEYTARSEQLKEQIKEADARLGIASTAQWNDASMRGKGYVDRDVMTSIHDKDFADRLDRLQHQIRTMHREHVASHETLWEYFLDSLDAGVVDAAWVQGMFEI